MVWGVGAGLGCKGWFGKRRAGLRNQMNLCCILHAAQFYLGEPSPRISCLWIREDDLNVRAGLGNQTNLFCIWHARASLGEPSPRISCVWIKENGLEEEAGLENQRKVFLHLACRLLSGGAVPQGLLPMD